MEIGLGDPPLSWSLLDRSTNKQPNGGLALWNTAGLPDGLYSLRLVVEDAQRGELSTFITVQARGEHPADPPFTATPNPLKRTPVATDER